MRRFALAVLAPLLASACVSVQSLPDPRGALKPGQRLVVAVYPSPGPWIIDASDSKLESAAKISPVGVFMQGFQDEHTLSVSKDVQQYLPRPHLGLEVHDALLQSLRQTVSSKTVQTTLEAGIVPDQLVAWNRAKDQLDWRLRYYGPDPDAPAPRDYARALMLDDALVLDVNVSYGTTATDDNKILPYMSAASRVYRGDTSRLIWEHEDEVSDATSSSTLAEFKIQPWELTGRLEKLAPALGEAVSTSFTKAFLVATATANALSGGSKPHDGGLVPMSLFQNQPPGAPAVSTATITPQTSAVSTTTAISETSAAPATPIVSTTTVIPAIGAIPPTSAVSSTTTVPAAADISTTTSPSSPGVPEK